MKKVETEWSMEFKFHQKCKKVTKELRVPGIFCLLNYVVEEKSKKTSECRPNKIKSAGNKLSFL